jgi:ribosome-binding ATPase YchF (GTP1/OBG family)
MDPQGNVGASTTISTANIHAGTATFPFATWRPAEGVIVHEVSDASYA